ncbi:hypothetical protein HY967_04710 [Candidatus Jorgensenbacteria bacterium]|nr:hypothetical protein [Candidatus Jorgensenbacteria bacterium]
MIVQTPQSWFERLGGSSIRGLDPGFPFRLRVLVPGYSVTPRHSMFEYFREMGSKLIPKVLRHEPLELGKDASLMFVLPERWMSVHEQQLFLYRLKNHPQARDMKAVDVITQEALIVGGLSSETLALFQIEGNDPEAGLMSENIN